MRTALVIGLVLESTLVARDAGAEVGTSLIVEERALGMARPAPTLQMYNSGLGVQGVVGDPKLPMFDPGAVRGVLAVETIVYELFPLPKKRTAGIWVVPVISFGSAGFSVRGTF